MLEVFANAKKNAKILKPGSVCIDNFVFTLHSRVTFCLLLAFVLLLGSRQYFGDPIHCNVDGEDSGLMNTYCWIHGTRTDVKLDQLESLRYHANLKQIPHPGMGPKNHPSIIRDVRKTSGNSYNMNKHNDESSNIFDRPVIATGAYSSLDGKSGVSQREDLFIHSYYQWIPLILVLSALSFYVPRLIWKSHEGGRMAQWCKDKKEQCKPSFNRKGDDVEKTKLEGKSFGSNDVRAWIELHDWTRNPAKELFLYMKVNEHRLETYSNYFDMCEILNMLIVILNFTLVNSLLGGRFRAYGSDILTFIFNSIFAVEKVAYKSPPSDLIFPKVSSCTFHKYGTSGFVQSIHALCVLPLNIVNEKIFILLWLWLIFLVVVDLLNLICKVFLIKSQMFRKTYSMLRMSRAMRKNGKELLEQFSISQPYHVWFTVHLISKNVHFDLLESLLFFILDEEYSQKQIRKEGKNTTTVYSLKDGINDQDEDGDGEIKDKNPPISKNVERISIPMIESQLPIYEKMNNNKLKNITNDEPFKRYASDNTLPMPPVHISRKRGGAYAVGVYSRPRGDGVSNNDFTSQGDDLLLVGNEYNITTDGNNSHNV